MKSVAKTTTAVAARPRPYQCKTAKGGWSYALLRAMDDPTQRVDSDDRIVIIKDGFPKARHHYLVLARADVESLAKVGREHVPLLEHMQAKARELATRIRDEATPNAPRPQFRIGYHAVPSMRRLHLHVVSQDFDSPCLKHKKHWHSFTSDFFMESSDVIALLKREGRVTIDRDYYEGLLKRPLACHRCGRATATMPALKDHIRTHDR